ncbi:DUF1294 domain-containing protein [Aliishimia ponticola]|uniref:DUF1294 domain-containing protein n=2 Tax=Aliishimia ponticola TaxID=2499833 RepID=A0A4S4NB49_9RHOB|nr:DUF1294 domain-containing protein [Aliishimia ponticola]
MMAWDKRCAIKAGRRIPERTLLLWALIGGAPGAKLAQQHFRHKTRKQPFAMVLNLCLAVVCALPLVALWLGWPGAMAG